MLTNRSYWPPEADGGGRHVFLRASRVKGGSMATPLCTTAICLPLSTSAATRQELPQHQMVPRGNGLYMCGAIWKNRLSIHGIMITRKELSEQCPVLTLAKQTMPTNIGQVNKQENSDTNHTRAGKKSIRAAGAAVLKLGSLEPVGSSGDTARGRGRLQVSKKKSLTSICFMDRRPHKISSEQRVLWLPICFKSRV